jgi:hypothetical protein
MSPYTERDLDNAERMGRLEADVAYIKKTLDEDIRTAIMEMRGLWKALALGMVGTATTIFVGIVLWWIQK